MKGIIALDIDGTITVDEARLEIPVKKYLEGLMLEEWKILLMTGRTFSFAKPILYQIEASFFCSVQNGAALLQFPQQVLLKKNYLSRQLLPQLEKLFHQESMGFLVESGVENSDICYFRYKDFPIDLHDYLRYRISISPESWREVGSFDEIPLIDFPVIKFFGSFETTTQMAKVLETKLGHETKTTVIRDPFRPGSYLAHVNKRGISKAFALKEFQQRFTKQHPLIAAGDDFNDVEMLNLADIRIVMQNAPEKVCDIADIIAPHAKEMGIIKGLQQAIASI